jgi:hypothetical protein
MRQLTSCVAMRGTLEIMRALGCIAMVGAALIFGVVGSAAPDGTVPMALDRRVADFEVHDVSVEEALKHLVGERGRTFVVGFEQAGETRSAERRITLRVERATIREILQAICSQDPRYEFSEPRVGVINISSPSAPAEARAILALHLDRLDVAVRDWPFNLFARIPEFAPDLRRYLEMRAEEYRRRTMMPPPGSPAVTMTTNVQPPWIELHLRDTTVRGALNAIAAYTLTHSIAGVAPNATLEPMGWKFWLQRDAKAPTGLGGYPHWDPF